MTNTTPRYRQQQIRRRRKLASPKTMQCIDCGGQAAYWSLAATPTHFDEVEGLWFSVNLEDYSPRCNGCHQLNATSRRRRRGDAA